MKQKVICLFMVVLLVVGAATPKKAYAVAGVDDAAVVIVCALLAAAGVTFASNDGVQDAVQGFLDASAGKYDSTIERLASGYSVYGSVGAFKIPSMAMGGVRLLLEGLFDYFDTDENRQGTIVIPGGSFNLIDVNSLPTSVSFDGKTRDYYSFVPFNSDAVVATYSITGSLSYLYRNFRIDSSGLVCDRVAPSGAVSTCSISSSVSSFSDVCFGVYFYSSLLQSSGVVLLYPYIYSLHRVDSTFSFSGHISWFKFSSGSFEFYTGYGSVSTPSGDYYFLENLPWWEIYWPGGYKSKSFYSVNDSDAKFADEFSGVFHAYDGVTYYVGDYTGAFSAYEHFFNNSYDSLLPSYRFVGSAEKSIPYGLTFPEELTAPDVIDNFEQRVESAAGDLAIVVPVDGVVDNTLPYADAQEQYLVNVNELGEVTDSQVETNTWLQKLLVAVKAIPATLINLLEALLVKLFSPSDAVLQGGFDGLLGAFREKTDYQTYMDLLSRFQNLSEPDLADLKVNWYGTEYTVVTWDFFRRTKATYSRWLRGFLYLFLLLFNFNNIYKLIRNGSLFNGSGHRGETGKGKGE